MPNAGKSSLFNALTRAGAQAANYPFTTVEPNVAVVGVPDERLDRVAATVGAKPVVHETIQFHDIAGLVRGAHQGEGLGNKFLANIREADAICQVVRVFADDDVIHVSGTVDPADDIEVVQTELMLADLQTIEKAIPRLEKEIKGKKTDPKVLAAVLAAQTLLESGSTLHASADAVGIDVSLLRELSLMTAKPFIYVFNVDEDGLTDEARQAELRALVAPADAVFLNAKLEAELLELDADDAAELLASVGQTEPGMDQLARVGFHTLGLQTFLTAGPMESRAWTIHQGWTAPQAAGVIHTDFERGFIKAEVVGYDDIVDAGSMAEAKARGKVRIEGKDYVMADGDVVEFRFNV